MTPWDFWARALDSGIATARTGFRFAELMQASNEVVASRCAAMAHAVRDPLNGDYRELSRMVPEKVDAFGSAARSTAQDMQAIGADAAANWRQCAGLALAGRLPTPHEVDAIARRTMRMAERALGAGGKAMQPVYRTATGNARRLSATR